MGKRTKFRESEPDKVDSGYCEGMWRTMTSRNFEEAFSSKGSGCMKKCVCGMIHFDTHNEWDWDCGELEELEKKAIEEPRKYVAHDHEVGSTVTRGHTGI